MDKVAICFGLLVLCASVYADKTSFPSSTEQAASTENAPQPVPTRQDRKVSFPGARDGDSIPDADGRAFNLPDLSQLQQNLLNDPRAFLTGIMSQNRNGLGQISGLLGGLNQIAPGFNRFAQSGVNMSDIAESSTRVAKELSKTLKVDVFAVSKALAGAGALVGSMVFVGGIAAMLATGMGYFNYSPALHNAPFYPPLPYGAAKYQYGNQQQAQFQERSAKAVDETKRPTNPELMPAIDELMVKLTKAIEQFTPKPVRK